MDTQPNKLESMLWYVTNSKLTFSEAVDEAVKYYEQKYGHKVGAMQLHTSEFDSLRNEQNQPTAKELTVNNIRFTGHRWVRPKHFIVKPDEKGSVQ